MLFCQETWRLCYVAATKNRESLPKRVRPIPRGYPRPGNLAVLLSCGNKEQRGPAEKGKAHTEGLSQARKPSGSVEL